MRLVDAKQMQAMDRYTIEEIGIPGIVLMENAARSWVDAVEPLLKPEQKIHLFCGAGNNGGDGYAIARILQNSGYHCRVIAVKPPKSADCRQNATVWSHYGDTVSESQFLEETATIGPDDVVVDAILGTGIETELRGPLVAILKRIDELPGTKIAVDLPSGISASTGDRLGAAIKADYTVTFQRPKVGHYLQPGKSCRGTLICRPISIQEWYENGARPYHLIDRTLVAGFLPRRRPDSYKNQYGHLAVWCGSTGTLGAAMLAAQAGLKSGAGLVTAALPADSRDAFLARMPELMTFSQAAITCDWLSTFDALVLGCGLGREIEKWGSIERTIRPLSLPMVLDADAFYGLRDWSSLSLENTVLMPHPGEFARASGFPKPKSNRERLEQGLAFVERYPTTLILKGAPTMVFDRGGTIYINDTGNAGMATAGSGDVLAGMVGGWLAQGLEPLPAALLGTWLHGRSGDCYRDRYGEETLTAGCLIDELPTALSDLRTPPLTTHSP
jgi:ADP-dependent NAD(P)H-hydrate dehydratase / NAD(P)H-hydrate epimerase